MNRFLLNFAKYFSDFSKIAKVMPESLLREMWTTSSEANPFDFIKIIKRLRDLRFDVRVYETNRTIPPGIFKVCYPFTMQYNKPIGVTWKDNTGVSNDDERKQFIQRGT
jgi:hypothetical protein